MIGQIIQILASAMIVLLPLQTTATAKSDTLDLAPVTISVLGDSDNRVGETAYFIVSIRNTSPEQIRIKNVSIMIDGPAAKRFLDPNACHPPDGEQKLPAGATLEYTCKLEMKSASIWSTGSEVQSSLLAANIRVSVTTDADQFKTVQMFPTFTIKAPEYSIFIGGWIGALMLALFVWVERILKNPSARQEWGMSLFVTTLLGARGGVMAVIALMLSKTTESSMSPVSLTVSDFAGGVLIGLFSYPLATWISSTLKLDDVFVPRALSDKAEDVAAVGATAATIATKSELHADAHEDGCDAGMSDVRQTTRDEDLPPATGGVA